MAVISTLANPSTYSFLLYSFLFGTSVYQSFIAGVLASKSLDRKNFSLLQNRIFPAYFKIQTYLPPILYLLTPATSPLITAPATLASGVTVACTASLGVCFALALANLKVLLPLSRKVIAARHEQEAKEGKDCKDPTASDEMKQLNKKFGQFHGGSMLLNLGYMVSLVVFGLGFAESLAA